MHHDSGASGQQPTSTITPSLKTAPANGQILDSQAQNVLHNHSTTPSPDPITMSKDDQEIVMLNHIPHLPQEQASFKPDVPLPSPICLQSLLKDMSKSKASVLIQHTKDHVLTPTTSFEHLPTHQTDLHLHPCQYYLL